MDEPRKRKTFSVTTEYSKYDNCYFIVDMYRADNSIHLEITNATDGPIAVITKCFGDAGGDLTYLDTNNCPWAEGLVTELEIAKYTGKTTHSGYCDYPLYKLNLEKLKEYY